MNDAKVRMKPNQGKMTRLSVPFTEQDERDIEGVKIDHERLSELPGEVTPESSKATLVHAIFEEGMKVVKERQMEKLYQEIATEERKRSKARYERVKSRRRGAPGVD